MVATLVVMARWVVRGSQAPFLATLGIAAVLLVALAGSESSVGLAISGTLFVVAALSLQLTTGARFVGVFAAGEQRQRVLVANGLTSEMRQSDPGVPGRPRSRAPAVTSAL